MHRIIEAVPGSGKTTTLARTIREAIQKGVDPEMIYAVTFTREAARELQKRCHPAIHASTIHSLAYTLLTRDTVENLGADYAGGEFYDQLLWHAQEQAHMFRAELLLVDEAQDLSLRQFEFLRALGAYTKDLVIVGDRMQSIFSFNGGDPRYMDAFKKILPEPEIVHLDRSYRIPEKIARFINAAFASEVPIRSEKKGGRVKTHIVPAETLLRVMCGHIRDHTAMLVRTNAEIFSVLHAMRKEIHAINYTIPLTSHPYVAFASAVIALGRGANIHMLANAARLFGGLSRGGHRAIRAFDGAVFARAAIGEIADTSAQALLHRGTHAPFIARKARKEISNLIAVFDQYYEFYGDTSPHAVRKLFDRLKADGYACGSLWDAIPVEREALVEAVLRARERASETYYTVDNGSTRELLTIHAAKGKEFDAALLAVNAHSIDIYDPEECRILYVGCTRAKKSLDIFVPERVARDCSRPNIIDCFYRRKNIGTKDTTAIYKQ